MRTEIIDEPCEPKLNSSSVKDEKTESKELLDYTVDDEHSFSNDRYVSPYCGYKY